MWTLNRQGKAPFVTPARGHEALQVASARALRDRPGLGCHLLPGLGRGPAARPHARTTACCRCWGRRMIRSAAADNSRGTSARRRCDCSARRAPWPRRSPTPSAWRWPRGCAGSRRRRSVYFGDGATSEGDFHESANFAGIHRLPVVFVCENNRYAISVPTSRQMPTATVAERAAAYGFPGVRVDGNDPLAVYGATRTALARARAGDGPTLLEAETYRLLPHSSDDDDRTYRDPAEVAAWEACEPVRRYGARLIALGLVEREPRMRRCGSDAGARGCRRGGRGGGGGPARRLISSPTFTPSRASGCRLNRGPPGTGASMT